MKALALRPYHELSGAVFSAASDWEVPTSYAFGDAEVLAVRRSAGIADVSDRAKVLVAGPDRTSFLHNLVTGDVESLRPGRAMSTLLLTDKGKVTGDLRILALADRYILDIDPLVAGPVIESIEKHLISDDVTLERTHAAHVAVLGPSSSGLLSRALDRDVPLLPLDVTQEVALGAGASATLVGANYAGARGVDVVSFDNDLARLWERLLAAGAIPVGRDALKTIRIEAGRPRAGVDMGTDTIALEARLEPWIDYTKGCYLGQETIARATYLGHMNRYLVGLSIEGDLVPEPREKLRTPEGKDIGFVTSATYSPTIRRVIALGYARAGSHEPGTRLQVEQSGWQLRASVVAMPFVPPR